MVKKLFIGIVLLTSIMHAQYSRPGSTAAQFLKIGLSPRGTAMSDAYVAVVEGAEAVHYNPAALARIKGMDLVFNHNEWFADISHEFAAVAYTFEDVGSFAVSFTGLYTDEMKVRTPLQPDGTGETFRAGSYRFGLSYARYLTLNVSIGVAVNYIYETLYHDFSAKAYSVDIAALYVTSFREFRLGLQIANFGSDMKFVNESYPLPTQFTFGLAMNAIEADEHKLTVSFSAVKPNDGKPLSQVGTEWNFQDFLFLRAGYPLNHDVASFSFGGGVQVDLSSILARVNYSYSDFRLLGVAHRIGIGLSLREGTL